MREYDFYIYQENEYGQTVVSAEPTGKVKMSIYPTNQSTQDNILYKGASYVALTHNSEVNDTYQIDFNGERLKVLYVSAQGRYRQVFLSRVG
jgi:hypothetical protein